MNNTMQKTNNGGEGSGDITFVDYRDESQLEHVDQLVALDLSEPYSVFTYRYFLNRFPDLCILAVDSKSGEVCGCVVGKIDLENMNMNSDPSIPEDVNNAVGGYDESNGDVDMDNRTNTAQHDGCKSGDTITRSTADSTVQTGYIGMLAVSKSYRRKGIGKDLVRQVLKRMKEKQCTSVTLETVSARTVNYHKIHKWDIFCFRKINTRGDEYKSSCCLTVGRF